MKNQVSTVTMGAWIQDQMQDAAGYASRAGLYGLPDEYREVVGPKVRAKAREFYGEPGADPVFLRERSAGMTQRREAILAGFDTNCLSDRLARILDPDSTAARGGWRPAVIVSIMFCLWGLLRHERTWEAWAVLVLGASCSVLVFQSARSLLRVVTEMSLLTGGLIRNAASLVAIDYRLNRLEAALIREEALRQRSARWVDETMSLLLAEYEHNKNIAVRARAMA